MHAISLQKIDLQMLREACAQLRSRLRAGDSTRVEDLLSSYPTLAQNDQAVLELIHVEVMTRSELGLKPTLDEWQERFPLLLSRMADLGSLRSAFGSEMPTLSDRTASAAELALSVKGPEEHPPRIGNYQILQEIGRGGMGVVYKARQSSLSRIVAIKMILAGAHAGLHERARLRNEAEAAAQLLHPNVVQIFEIGEHDGLSFLAMEYVAGGNLTRMLRGTPQAFRWSARLTETLARAIHVAHERGIIHRDLNPSNILMAPDGAPKISDFGLAKLLVDDHGISLNGVLLGTPSYMSPEQASGNGKQIGPCTDVYALGALLYEMLTGAAPFRGLTPMETLCQVMEAELVPPSRLRHGVPEDLETICLKCLDRDPARRYSTAEELGDDLKRFQESQPIRARRTSRFRKAMQWRRRQPLAASLLGLSVLLFLMLLGVVGAYTLYMAEKNRQLERQSSQDEKMRSLVEIQRAKYEEEARSARRQTYDSLLNQAKQSFDAGQVELAQELFEHLNSRQKPDDARGFEWHYFDSLLRQTAWLLSGHTATVTCLSVSRHGGTLVSGDSAGKIIVWDLARRTPRTFQAGHDSSVRKIAIASDPQHPLRTIASVSRRPDRSLDVKLWAPEIGAVVSSLRTDLLEVTDLQFSPDGEILTLCGQSAVGDAGQTRAWRREGSGWRPDTERNASGITRLAFSPDGKLLALCRSDGTIQLRAFSLPRPAPVEQRPGGPVLSLAFSRDGKRLAAGRKDRSMTVWDTATGRILSHSTDQDGPVVFLDFCLDGETLVGCDGGSIVWTRRLTQPNQRRLLPSPESRIDFFSLSPDGRTLAAGGKSHPVTVWDLTTGVKGRTYLANNRSFRQIEFTPDGTSLVLLCDDHEIRTWRFGDSPESRRTLAGHDAEAWTLAFSPEGDLLASGGDDHTIKLWDVQKEREWLTLKGHDQTVTSVAFFPDGEKLVSVSLDGRVILWDLTRSGKNSERISARPRLLHTYKDRLRAVTVSSNGERLAVAGSNGTIEIWDLVSNRVQFTLRGHEGNVHALLYSPNPSVLASASADHTVRFWEAGTGLPSDAKACDGVMRTLAFSANGLLLAAAGESRLVTLFSMDNWTQKMALKGHPLTVRCLAFSPDQQTLATGCDDQKVRLWDISTGQFFYSLRGHSDRINAVAFSPDGETLASCDHKGVIYLWRTRLQSPSPRAPAVK
jgi:WD40 repeat protein/serine/threonine protein kinase